MKQILNNIIDSFINIWWSIWSFFWNIETYIIRAILIYIIVIVLLVLRLKYSRKTFTSIVTVFDKDIDDLYHRASLILYNNKDNIYEFTSNIPLLLQYKTQEIQKRDKANYYNNYHKLIDEVDYIGQLTDTTIDYNHSDLDAKYTIVHKLSQNISYIQNTLSLFTLWISNLFF